MRIYRKPKSADLWLLFADWFQLGNSSRCFACRLNNVCRHIGNELKWKDKRRERAIDQFNRVSSKVVVFLWHFPVFIGKSKFVSRSLIVAQKILQITGAQSFWSEQRCSFTHDSLAFVVICERQIRTCSWSHHFICQRWKKLLRQTKKCEEKRKWKGINIIKVASLWLFQSADVVVDCKSIETIVDSCFPLLVLSLSLCFFHQIAFSSFRSLRIQFCSRIFFWVENFVFSVSECNTATSIKRKSSSTKCANKIRSIQSTIKSDENHWTETKATSKRN